MHCSEGEYRDNLSEDSAEAMLKYTIKNYKVVGLGASILNGYSYAPYTCCLPVYTPVKDMNDIRGFFFRFVYLEDYNEEIGYEEGNIPSPERTICDYLMYPKELHAYLYLVETLEGYEEEYNNFDRVYEMMKLFNIPKDFLSPYINDMWCEE